MELPELPPVSLARLALARKPGLSGQGGVPRIEAVVRRQTAGSVADYQRICGFPVSDVLPLTYPQVLAAPLHMAVFAHPEFPLPAMGMVHVRNSIRQLRAVRAGETFDLRVLVEGHEQARRGVEIDLQTELRVDGEAVWRASTVILSAAGPGHGKRLEREPEPEPRLQRSTAWSLPEDLGRRYGGVSGDRNPIHLYPLTARIFGFPRHIIHGMWTLARCVSELDADLPEAVLLECGFRRPIPLPSTVVFESGEVPGGLGFRVSRKGVPAVEGRASAL